MKPVYGLLLAILLGACQATQQDGLEIADLRIRPPLPGSKAAVAYFRLVNHGRDEVEIRGVSSDSFAAAEIHRSLLEEGISKMRRVEVLRVPGQGGGDFAPGGYHVMLFRPLAGLAPGQRVSISLEYGDNGAVTASVAYRDGF